MIESDRKRYNPPSEDFAETRQMLNDVRQKNQQLLLINKRLHNQVQQLEMLVSDILDDTLGISHDTE